MEKDGMEDGMEDGMKIGLSPKLILFFSVSRIVPFFMFVIKSLFFKGKKCGALFSLCAAHMAFERVGNIPNSTTTSRTERPCVLRTRKIRSQIFFL